MKERRKRRSAKDIKESIINAATHLIETEGFSNLTVTGIMRQAEIEPVQFYNRYDDLNKFIDEYVKKYDYWFSDIVKLQKQSSNDKVENPLKVVPLIHSNLTPVKFSHSPFCLFLFSSYSSCPLCRVLH